MSRRSRRGPGAALPLLIVLALGWRTSSPAADLGGSPFRSCGANCLFVVAKYRGLDCRLESIREELKPSASGEATLADLERASAKLGLRPLSARLEASDLGTVPMPAIVQVRRGSSWHFEVLAGWLPEGAATVDAPIPATIHPAGEFLGEWTGIALLFPRDRAEEVALRSRLSGAPEWASGLPLAGLAIASGATAWALLLGRRRGLALATLGLILIGCGGEPSPPRLQVPAVADLGLLPPGERAFSVALRNRGDLPLRVEKVASTCSCTEAGASGPIPARGAGSLVGKVQVRPGPGSAELSILSNDTGRSTVIRLRWFGEGTPSVSPSSLRLSIRSGRVEERMIEVSYPNGEDPVRLDSVEVAGLPEGSSWELLDDNPAAIRATPGLAASLSASPAPVVGVARLRLRIRAPEGPGSRAWACLVKVAHRGVAREIPVAIECEVHEGIRVSPRQLLFGSLPLDDLRRVDRRILIDSDIPDDRFEVVEKPDYLAVAIEPAAGGRSGATLTARVASEPPAGLTRPSILLRNSAGARVWIPVLVGSGQ